MLILVYACPRCQRPLAINVTTVLAGNLYINVRCADCDIGDEKFLGTIAPYTMLMQAVDTCVKRLQQEQAG